MAKGSKLLSALDRYKGKDHKQEHQKKLQKQAEKRKRAKLDHEDDKRVLAQVVAERAQELENGAKADKSKKRKKTETAKDDDDAQEDGSEAGSEGWETDESDAQAEQMDLLARLEDSETSESEDEEDDAEDGAELEGEDDEDEDIPLSDIESLASEDRGDILPHQRLTINNTTALLKAYKSIALPSNLSFTNNQTITTDEPVQIADIEDDLNRELAFYRQSLDAVTKARDLLKKEGTPFSRPADYFAEMVKSDEHMGKIKQKLIDEAASKKASADARRQRDLKKFGKQVQVAKLQERDRAKRDTMDKINLLKRSKCFCNSMLFRLQS